MTGGKNKMINKSTAGPPETDTALPVTPHHPTLQVGLEEAVCPLRGLAESRGV